MQYSFMPHMASALPSELSDKIMDCLASDNRTLANCSLVHRDWIDRARHHLWQKIRLRGSGNSDKSQLIAFINVLRLSPALATRILHLTLSSYYEPHDRDPEYPRGIIFQLLEALPALGTLKLESVRLNLSHAAEVGPFPTLKTLSMASTSCWDIAHFHHFVCAFPALDNLSIGCGTRWRVWEGTDVVERCACKINRLEIGVDYAEDTAVAWPSFLSSIDVTTLCVREMPWYLSTDDWFKSAWDACIPTVRSLELDLRYFEGNGGAWGLGPVYVFQGNHPAIDLADAASLRNITATVAACDAAEGICVLLHPILETCPPAMCLDSCTIKITASIGQKDDDHYNEALGKQWANTFDDEECPTFDDVRIPCESLAMRLVHPLKWDEFLYEGLRAIWSAGVPLRLEYTTDDGAVHTSMSLKGNEDVVSFDTLDI